MSRIYILTGAAGLLGSNTSRQLIENGERVRAFVLEGDPAAKYIPEQAEIVYGDLLNTKSLERLFDVPDDSEIYVIHSASIVTLNPNPNPKVHAVNVDGTKNIINMCLRHNVKKLVYISSTSAIPELPHGQKIYETDHFLPTDGLVGYYAITKAEASQAVLDAVAAYPQFDASIIHPSGICGPNDYSFGPVAQMVKQYISGDIKMGLEGTFNSVDVRDLAAGVIACCDKGKRGECYIMSNELVTMKQLFDIINETADLDIKANILPKGIAKMAVKLLRVQSKFTGKEPLLNDFALYNLTRNNDFDCTKARNELGFTCRPFAETIKDEVEWLREEGRASESTEKVNIPKAS
ncbi:MAG: NAD-dependent epimerase/dehydratase family protein [Butyrivibrio sp.]|uniref:NAD-dependent epimerase/dehydratase family protein n=1 Tax=Butyrivibrio sp. TaxID=28121 RepID=UPI0025E4A6E3|nr:NAD-dependent epimerase/dehydratase family protein [Butyrivibrio sp.]MCR5773344.1 NAD-dependent epimerase/dehydratase family protein [Butyrivibrio sp.]